MVQNLSGERLKAQEKSGLEDAGRSLHLKSPGLCGRPVGRLLRRCTGAPGTHATASCARHIALGCSWKRMWEARI